MRKKRILAGLLALVMAFALFTVPGGVSVSADDFDSALEDNTPRRRQNVDGYFDPNCDMDESERFNAFIVEWLGEEFLANREMAYELHLQIESRFSVARDGSTIYPDYYGGRYLGNDGRLVILVTETNILESRTSVISDIMIRDDVHTRLVTFSYNDLRTAQEYIFTATRLTNHPVIGDNVTTVWVDVMYNHLVVGLETFNEEQIALFRAYVFDSPMLYFVQSSRRGTMELYIAIPEALYGKPLVNEYGQLDIPIGWILYNDEFVYRPEFSEIIEIEPLTTVIMNPGSRIYIHENGSVFGLSIGYRVTRRNAPTVTGFLTAPHGQRRNTNVFNTLAAASMNLPSLRVGVMDNVVFQGSVDAGFVRNDTSVLNLYVTNNLPGTGRTHTVGIRTPFANDPIISIGATSTSNGVPFRTGSVTDLSFNDVLNGQILNLTLTNANGMQGDSGGIVVWGGNLANVPIMGLITSVELSPGNPLGREMAFSRAAAIRDNFNMGVDTF